MNKIQAINNEFFNENDSRDEDEDKKVFNYLDSITMPLKKLKFNVDNKVNVDTDVFNIQKVLASLKFFYGANTFYSDFPVPENLAMYLGYGKTSLPIDLKDVVYKIKVKLKNSLTKELIKKYNIPTPVKEV